MRISIDSCVFIRGLGQGDPSALRLFTLIGPDLVLVIPRLIAQEVIRNLATPEQARLFYRLFHQSAFAFIVDEPTPAELVAKYVSMGLRQKADAFIGAFTEWMESRYLISDNRHFLRELSTSAFTVLDADGFLQRWDSDSPQERA
jgi:hypothetical protein